MSPALAQAITNMLHAVTEELEVSPYWRRPAQGILDAALELSAAWKDDPDNSELMHVDEVTA